MKKAKSKSKAKTIIIVLAIVFSMLILLSLCSEDTDTPENDNTEDTSTQTPSDDNNSNNNSSNNPPSKNETSPNPEPTPTPELPKTKKSYIITFSAQKIENNSVGDTWSYGAQIGTTKIQSGSTVTLELSAGPTVTLYAIEDDANKDDKGSKDAVFSDLELNQEETKTIIVTVTENDGRYSGNVAKWEFTITCKRVENQ